jgi:hypothetical protein
MVQMMTSHHFCQYGFLALMVMVIHHHMALSGAQTLEETYDNGGTSLYGSIWCSDTRIDLHHCMALSGAQTPE